MALLFFLFIAIACSQIIQNRHWPAPPFSYAFDNQQQYSLIFVRAFGIGDTLEIERSRENIQGEIDYTRGQPDWYSGPNILNITDSDGDGPWLGCKKADTQWLGIPWKMVTTRDFLLTMQTLIAMNGFQEFHFSIGENEERLIAHCSLEFDVDHNFYLDAAEPVDETWKGLEVMQVGNVIVQ